MVESYREYDKLVRASQMRAQRDGVYPCPDKAFDALRDYVEAAECAEGFFSLGRRAGIGEYITLKNYVGAVCLADGVQLEILPKICGIEKDDKEQARRLVLDMLRCLSDAPSRRAGGAELSTSRMPLPELFIRMFTEEAQRLVRSGIRADYVRMEENLTRVRGRILVGKQLRHNLLHPERIFCAYDEFHQDCPENRLVKKTLRVLRVQTAKTSLKTDIDRLLGYFDAVSDSTAPAADFARVRQDRNRSEYALLLEWARVFLQGLSYSPYSGRGNAMAMLFPMERLFEDYVAHHIRRFFSSLGWRVKTQSRSHYLFEDGKHAAFLLKPDILLKKGEQTVVLDTKWKVLLNNDAKHYGVSQADMYQMNAYADRYEATQIYLLYPHADWMAEHEPIATYRGLPNKGNVTLYPIKLTDILQSMEKLRALIDGNSSVG